MRARDLAEDFPLVRLDDDALGATRMMLAQRRPGVVVVDDTGRPASVLPGSQLLRFLLPGYVVDDPSLARVLDEDAAAEACIRKLSGKSVRELLPKDEEDELPRVSGDATVLECAAVMARLHTPLIVVSDDHEVHGVVTASHLLERLVGDGST